MRHRPAAGRGEEQAGEHFAARRAEKIRQAVGQRGQRHIDEIERGADVLELRRILGTDRKDAVRNEIIGQPGLSPFPRRARQPRRIERADGLADERQIVRRQRQQRHARLPVLGEEPLRADGRQQAAHVKPVSHGGFVGVAAIRQVTQILRFS